MNPDIMQLVSSFLGNVGGGNRRGVSPWAIRAEEVAASLQVVSTIRRASGVSGAERAVMAQSTPRAESLAPGSYATRIGNVAIVPVFGPLVARFSFAYWSYEEIVRDLRLAASAPGIDAILMEIDSPGGMVSGVDSVPAEVARIRESMPVHAHVRGLGASAAYWVASAAERVTADRTSLVGSVGALIHYVDLEGILSKLGANIVNVVASQSPNKRLDPSSDAGQAELQAIVDDGAEMFIEALAQNRGVDRQAILDGYGQGLVFTARDALSRSMIDGIETMDSVLAGLAARSMSQSGTGSAALPPQPQEQDMPEQTNTAAIVGTAAAITLASIKAEHPDIVAQLQAEGASLERSRIAGIEEHAAGLVGVEQLVAEMKADGKTTPEQAAGKLLAASKAGLATRLKGLEQLDQAAAGVTSTPSSAGASGAAVPQTPEGWTAEWNAKADLQAEYPTVASYVATMKRKALAA